MRIFAIGLGGAGCRIANALYANDRKSSKVTCVQALAVDVDSETLAQLRALPEQAKIGFMASASDLPVTGYDTSQAAKIEIGEVISRIQNTEKNETDAYLICCGLGGSVTDVVPHLISALRATVAEPIFGLVTLPTLSEGEKRSAKAADDIENISPLLDGTILFDNETWSKKIADRRDALLADMSSKHGLLGFGKNQPKPSAQDITYKLLNQSIIRRISIILRAGEFRADGGIDLAEVVMDSSEVLNTIKGMGFISIGYAVEHLHQEPLAFLSRLRPANATLEQRKSAERIIELAKKAIYQEVSIPCDMTSAAKALILIAGPSHEISMKGVMTVRKWIDRSIAGMEMRSGDYPVTNSKYVAIIIVLSGLENIPRITELNEIREQYRSGVSGRRPASSNLPSEAGAVLGMAVPQGGPALRDEMISLPGDDRKRRGHDRFPEEDTVPYTDSSLHTAQAPAPVALGDSQVPAGRRLPRIFEEEETEAESRIPAPDQPASPRDHAAEQRKPQAQSAGRMPTETPVRRHTFPTGRGEDEGHRPPVRVSPAGAPPEKERQHPVKKPLESGYEAVHPIKHTPVTSRERDHQNIERVLKRQQVTIPSKGPTNREADRKPEHVQIPAEPETKTVIRRVTSKATVHRTVSPAEPMAPPPVQEERTIVRVRKKVTKTDDSDTYDEPEYRPGPAHQEELLPAAESEEFIPDPHVKKTSYSDKDRIQPARDDIFQGKSVSQKEPLRVKDAALLHTDIKTKKRKVGYEGDAPAKEPENGPAKKKTGKSSDQGGKISWIND